MSDREKVALLLEKVPDYNIALVVAYLEGLTAADESEQKYCRGLYEDYLNDPDHGEFVSFDEALKECGVSKDEL